MVSRGYALGVVCGRRRILTMQQAWRTLWAEPARADFGIRAFRGPSISSEMQRPRRLTLATYSESGEHTPRLRHACTRTHRHRRARTDIRNQMGRGCKRHRRWGKLRSKLLNPYGVGDGFPGDGTVSKQCASCSAWHRCSEERWLETSHPSVPHRFRLRM